MPTTAAEGSEVAGDQLVYYIKECPVSPKICKGQRWNKKKWGYTMDAAVLRFKDQLRNKHGIMKPELTEEL